MLTPDEDVEITALAKRGWSISVIAHHVGRDRKTVRAHLRGDCTPGVRRPAKPDDFEPFVAYIRARFDEDRTCGSRPCSTSWSGWASPGAVRPSPASISIVEHVTPKLRRVPTPSHAVRLQDSSIRVQLPRLHQGPGRPTRRSVEQALEEERPDFGRVSVVRPAPHRDGRI